MSRRPSLARPFRAALAAAAVALSAVALVALLAEWALAQAPVWVSLDGSPAGVPAEVTFDGATSDPYVTRGHVEIHGFWRTARTEGPLTYDVLEVPGLPNLDQVGAPRLPLVSLQVGVLTGAASTGLELNGVTTSVLPGYLVWPTPAISGHDEVFTADPAIYGSVGPWPVQPGAFDVGATGLGGLPRVATASLDVFQWDPSTSDLLVLRSFDFALFHPGAAPTTRSVTLPKYQFANTFYFNSPALAPYVLWSASSYEGAFLFIRPPGYAAAIAPLVQQKKARGFAVTVLSTDEIGTGCLATRAAIASWYGSVSTLADRYCILVGDWDTIPFCTDAEVPAIPDDAFWSDRPYACPTDLTVAGKQVMVGRFTGSTPAEVADEVARTLAYEGALSVDATHTRVVLAAGNVSYAGLPASDWQEYWIQSHAWGTPMAFVTQFGDDPGVSNASLLATLDAGAGILDYLGDNLEPGWYQWDLAAEYLYWPELSPIANGPYCPIVWSPSCDLNKSLPPPSPFGFPTMGQAWMRQGMDGACAVYAADFPVAGAWNDGVHRGLYTQVLDHGNRVHGYAITAAETDIFLNTNRDPRWHLVLFGDPQMTVRVEPVATQVVDGPVLTPCGGCTSFEVTLANAESRPLTNAKVGVYKPAAGTQAEVIASAYTDAGGTATLELPELAAGQLYWTVESMDGEAGYDSVTVADPLAVEGGARSEQSLRARPSLVGTATEFAFGRALRAVGKVEVFDAQGRRVSEVRVETGARTARWTPAGASGARLAAGVYLARLIEDGAISRCRVVVR